MTTPQITLVIGNTNTSIYGSTWDILRVLDKELRYPTPVARETDPNFAPPAGEWDGWIRLLKQYRSMPPSFPTGLIYRVEELAAKWGYQVHREDTRVRPVTGFPDHPGGYPLRPYQKDAVEAALAPGGYVSGLPGGAIGGRGVLDMVPRSGKSLVAVHIVARLGLRTLWTAPTDAIVRQTLRTFSESLGDHYAIHQQGAKNLEKAMEARVVLCTTATAVRLPPEFYATREVLITDEVHPCAAQSSHEIAKLCDHIYYRYGLTGTFFRSGEDAMAMHALLSNTIYRVTSQDLLDLGYLVPTHVAYIPVDAPQLRCPSDDPRIVPQLKYGIQEHDYRNQLVAYAAMYLEKVGRKVLVLVATKEQGRRLKSMILNQVGPKADGAEFDPVEFISTDRHRAVQGRILKAYNESDEIRVLIGTSLVGEGVDLPPADALVYARGEKAEVTLTQNAYRVITAIEGKTDAIIVDFADRHNKMLMKHSQQRLAVFHNEPIFKVNVLPSIKNFAGWLRDFG